MRETHAVPLALVREAEIHVMMLVGLRALDATVRRGEGVGPVLSAGVI